MAHATSWTPLAIGPSKVEICPVSRFSIGHNMNVSLRINIGVFAIDDIIYSKTVICQEKSNGMVRVETMF